MTTQTPAQRQKSRRARGLPVSIVITDPEAAKELRILSGVCRGPKAAITALLRAHAGLPSKCS